MRGVLAFVPLGEVGDKLAWVPCYYAMISFFLAYITIANNTDIVYYVSIHYEMKYTALSSDNNF